MTDWPAEWVMQSETNGAWAVDERQLQGLHFTPGGSAIVRWQNLLVRILKRP